MSKPSGGELKVHVLDVGHGDSLIVEFPNRQSFGIIDCHRHAPSHRGFGYEYDSAEPKALTYFRKLLEEGVEPHVDFACLTHPHIDHYRGYADLIQRLGALNIPIGEFWDFGASSRKADALFAAAQHPEEQEKADELHKLIQQKFRLTSSGSWYRVVSAPSPAFWSDHGVVVDVLAPTATLLEQYWAYLALGEEEAKQKFARDHEYAADDNTASAAFLVKYGQCRIVLGGDATNLSWHLALRDQSRCHASCHAIKVSHHGSLHGNFPHKVNYTGRLSGLLPDAKAALWPLITPGGVTLTAVISGGYRAALPHKETVDSLDYVRADVLCTGAAEHLVPKPYRPGGGAGQWMQEQLGREGIREVDECATSGHGNIILIFSPDGSGRVEHEL